MIDGLLRRLGLRRDRRESDVPGDPALAETRDTGGRSAGTGDASGTTGTGANDTFVGRVAGQGDGSGDMRSGAEVRALGLEADSPPSGTDR